MTRILLLVRHHGHDHSVHAEWLGSNGRFSGNGRQRSFPDEGCRSLGGIDLLAETGRRATARRLLGILISVVIKDNDTLY
jgi:hypothetical protein